MFSSELYFQYDILALNSAETMHYEAKNVPHIKEVSPALDDKLNIKNDNS